MTLKLVLGAAALALMLPGEAFADCGITDALLKQAYPAAQQGENGLLVKGGEYDRRISPDEVVCKAWPYRPELMLAAVPLIETAPPVEGENRGDVEIIIADVATGAPLARRLEKGMAFSDAIQFGSLALDTARYDLGPDLRAFGLRTSQSGSSSVNPYREQALWLYTFDKGRIERVLDGLIVERSNGETDSDCKGWSTTVKRSVTMGPRAGAAHRDLLVEQSVTHETGKKAGDDCRWSKRPGAGAKVRFSFAQGSYRPPAGVKARAEGDPEKDLLSGIEVEAAKP